MPSSRLAASLFAVLLSAHLCVAQSAGSAPKPPAPQNPRTAPADKDQDEAPAASSPKAATLPPNTPVITIHGYCEAPKAAAAAAPAKSGCTTVITRAEFEKLVNTLQPNMPPQVRRQLATQYPQILFMAQQARRRGLEQNDHYLQVLKFTKMELLKLELERSLNQQAEKVTDADIAEYYKKNTSVFDQTTFLRVFVPKTRQSDAPKEGALPADAEAVRKNSESEMAKVAADLRARAAAGEEFDKLQKDAYDAAGVKATPPPTLNANVRRGNLSGAQSAIFDLKPGDASGVLNDPTGFYFFKVVSKTAVPLADVKDDIRTTLRNQRLQAVHQAMENAVTSDLNKDYFPDSPAAPPAMPGAPHRMPTNSMRPATTTPPPAQPKE